MFCAFIFSALKISVSGVSPENEEPVNRGESVIPLALIPSVLVCIDVNVLLIFSVFAVSVALPLAGTFVLSFELSN